MVPETFEDVLESACAQLLTHAAAEVYAKGAAVSVAEADARDVALAHVWTQVPLAKRFSEPEALRVAIERRDPTVRFASLALLLHVDAKAGRELVIRWAEGTARGKPFATSRDRADPYAREHEIARPSVVRAFGAVLVPTLSIEELMGPFAALPVGEAAEQAFLQRAECRSAAGVVTLLRMLAAPSTSPLTKPLLLALAADGAPGLVEALVPTLAVTTHALREQVAWTLRDLGNGREALADALDLSHPLPRSRYGEVATVEGTMLEAWVQRELARPFDELCPRLFAPEVLAQPNGVDVMSSAFRHGVARPEILASDAFADACVALLALPKKALPQSVGWYARDTLERMGSARAEAAAARAAAKKKTTPAAKKPAKKAMQQTSDRVERYRRGDAKARIAVWDELHALGATVLTDPALLAEADGVASETIAVLQRNLERIAAALTAGGYVFAGRPVTPARKGAPAAIARLEKTAGVALPRLLAALHRTVDGVDLAEDTEAEESSFLDLGRCHPLVLAPLAVAAKDRELREESAKVPKSLRPAPLLYVSPTPGTIYDPDDEVADDDALVAVLAEDGLGADARVRREHDDHEEWLVDHLRRAMASGGFLGLRADDPRGEELAKGLEPL